MLLESCSSIWGFASLFRIVLSFLTIYVVQASIKVSAHAGMSTIFMLCDKGSHSHQDVRVVY